MCKLQVGLIYERDARQSRLGRPLFLECGSRPPAPAPTALAFLWPNYAFPLAGLCGVPRRAAGNSGKLADTAAQISRERRRILVASSRRGGGGESRCKRGLDHRRGAVDGYGQPRFGLRSSEDHLRWQMSVLVEFCRAEPAIHNPRCGKVKEARRTQWS